MTKRSGASKKKRRQQGVSSEPPAHEASTSSSTHIYTGDGDETGFLPNLRWGALSEAALRGHPGYRALPPPAGVCLAGPRTHRYVRQHSDTWLRLREGVLTSEHLMGALGMKTPAAVKLLGLPSGHASNSAAIEAYHHLRAGTEPALETAQEAERALQENEAAVDGYNRGKEGEAGAPAGAAGVDDERRARSEAVAASNRGAQGVRCGWGSAQEAGVLYSLAAHLAGTHELSEAGLCRLDPGHLDPAWGVEFCDLPPIGASPDGFLRQVSSDGGTRLEEGAAGGSGSSVEVVEVKCVCPFKVGRVVGKRAKRAVWCLDDSGPHTRVSAHHVPQVQMEMLVAGVDSALLVSASATRGVNVFRMQRCREFQGIMLRLLRHFYADYVRPSVQPPRDVFLDLAEHRRLLQRTRELMLEAVLVATIEVPERPPLPPYLQRPFL